MSQMQLNFILNEDAQPEGGDAGVQEPTVSPATARAENFEPLHLHEPDRPTRLHNFAFPSSPRELFQTYFPLELVQEWTSWTNHRAATISRPIRKRSLANYWRETNTSELYLFISALIYIAFHRENALSQYWNTSWISPDHPIAHFISRERFEAIYSFFTIWNPFPSAIPSQPKEFARVQALSNHISRVTLALFLPGTKIVVDEAMVRFTGRSRTATVIKGKPIPRGYRIWVLAADGIFLTWLFHINNVGPLGIPFPRTSGRQCLVPLPPNATDHERSTRALNNTQQVVVTLLDQLPVAEYHLFVDNLFSSPALFLHIRHFYGIPTTGTARVRSGIDREFVRLKQKDSSRDFVIWNTLKTAPYPGGLLNQFAWKDNALALFFSTYYTGDESFRTRVHKRPQTKTAQIEWGTRKQMAASLPEFADTYNLVKGAVDRGDQRRSTNEWDHRVRKSRHYALFLEFLLDVALINTFEAQLRFCGPLRWRRALSQPQWREVLLADLISHFGPDAGARKKCFDGTTTPGAANTVAECHNLIYRKKKGDCYACKGKTIRGAVTKRKALGEISANGPAWLRTEGRRKTTRYGCRVCDVPICNNDICWYLFHEQNASEMAVPKDITING